MGPFVWSYTYGHLGRHAKEPTDMEIMIILACHVIKYMEMRVAVLNRPTLSNLYVFRHFTDHRKVTKYVNRAWPQNMG